MRILFTGEWGIEDTVHRRKSTVYVDTGLLVCKTSLQGWISVEGKMIWAADQYI